MPEQKTFVEQSNNAEEKNWMEKWYETLPRLEQRSLKLLAGAWNAGLYQIVKFAQKEGFVKSMVDKLSEKLRQKEEKQGQIPIDKLTVDEIRNLHKEVRELCPLPQFALLIFKPLVNQNAELQEEIIKKLEDSGCNIKYLRPTKLDAETAGRHYFEHHNKKDFPWDALVKYMSQELFVCIAEENLSKKNPSEKRPFCQRIREDIIGPRNPQNIPEDKIEDFIRGLVITKPLSYLIPVKDLDPKERESLIQKIQSQIEAEKRGEKTNIPTEQKITLPEEEKIKPTSEQKLPPETKEKLILDNLVHCSGNLGDAVEEILNIYTKMNQPEITEEYIQKFMLLSI